MITSSRSTPGSETPKASPAGSAAVARLEQQVCAGYLVVQTVGGIVQWAAVYAWATWRKGYELVPEHPEVTDGFLVPDILLIVASALAAWGVWRARSWAVPATAVVAGLVIYPTVYLVAWVLGHQGRGGIALAVMVPTAMCAVAVAARTWRHQGWVAT